MIFGLPIFFNFFLIFLIFRVTLEDLKSAEQLVKKKQQQENQQRTSELQQLVASQQQKSSPTPPTISTNPGKDIYRPEQTSLQFSIFQSLVEILKFFTFKSGIFSIVKI